MEYIGGTMERIKKTTGRSQTNPKSNTAKIQSHTPHRRTGKSIQDKIAEEPYDHKRPCRIITKERGAQRILSRGVVPYSLDHALRIVRKANKNPIRKYDYKLLKLKPKHMGRKPATEAEAARALGAFFQGAKV